MAIFSPRRFFALRSRARICLAGSVMSPLCSHRRSQGWRRILGPAAWLTLLGLVLVHVFDIGFVEKKIGLAVPVHFQAGLVVPLDDAAQLFSIAQHKHHRRLGLHLLDVIEIFGVGLIGRNGLLLLLRGPARWAELLFDFVKRRTYEFSINRLHSLPSLMFSVSVFVELNPRADAFRGLRVRLE